MLWVPSGKNSLFPGGGTVEPSLAGREAVSSANGGRMFQSEGGGQEPGVLVAARSLWLVRGRTRGWKRREPASQSSLDVL